MTERVAGLDDRPRPGRPHTVPRPKIAQVVALTLKGPPRGHTHWTTRDLARRVGVSYGMVHRIWQAHGLQHHRVETFEFTTDPAAAAKIRDSVGFYLDPPANAAEDRPALPQRAPLHPRQLVDPQDPGRPGLGGRLSKRPMRTAQYAKFGDLEGSGPFVSALGQQAADAISAKTAIYSTPGQLIIRRRVADLSF